MPRVKFRKATAQDLEHGLRKLFELGAQNGRGIKIHGSSIYRYVLVELKRLGYVELDEVYKRTRLTSAGVVAASELGGEPRAEESNA